MTTSSTPKPQVCATCHRTMSEAAARRWIARPDGLGLLCPVCQRRIRSGQPTDVSTGTMVPVGVSPIGDSEDGHATSVGATVRLFRRAVDLSQVELASRARVSPAYLSQIERGERRPSAAALRRVLEALADRLHEGPRVV